MKKSEKKIVFAFLRSSIPHHRHIIEANALSLMVHKTLDGSLQQMVNTILGGHPPLLVLYLIKSSEIT